MVALPSIKEIWFGVDGYGTWKESEVNTSEIKNFISKILIYKLKKKMMIL